MPPPGPRARVALALALAAAALALPPACARSALYNTTGGPVEGKINVHIISHTHNDPGWLSSYTQYHRTLVLDGHVIGGVEAILDTVVLALMDNPDRTFVYADLAFFIKWWQELHDDTRAIVRHLVQEGRLEFTNGGVTQHDEATSHYSGMVDQMTIGMRFLQREFGVSPRIAWQLDGFGHSSTEPLLKAMGGFEALFFGRTDQADMDQRKPNHDLELLWRGSNAYGAQSELFTCQYPTGNYGPPSMTWFFERRNDYAKSYADSVQDDPETESYNADQVVDAFVAKAEEWAAGLQGRDVLFMMGSDFTHSDARSWFHNVDKMVHYANKDGRVNAFYSTPSRYLEAKRRAAPPLALSLKTDDFFPYSSNAQGSDYWTGYFTSRPTLKWQVRAASALLQATRQVEVLAELAPSGQLGVATTRGGGRPERQRASAVVELGRRLAPDEDAAVLEFAVALSLHHDGITGTQKRPVTEDYYRWLHAGMAKAAPKFLKGLELLLYPGVLRSSAEVAAAAAKRPAAEVFRRRLLERRLRLREQRRQRQPLEAEPVGGEASGRLQLPPQLSMCLLLNATACAATEKLSAAAKSFLLVVYNPLAWQHDWGVRLPVADGVSFAVTGPDGAAVPSQLLPLPDHVQAVWSDTQAASKAAKQLLAMRVGAPPLGHAVYRVEVAASPGAAAVEPLRAGDPAAGKAASQAAAAAPEDGGDDQRGADAADEAEQEDRGAAEEEGAAAAKAVADRAAADKAAAEKAAADKAAADKAAADKAAAVKAAADKAAADKAAADKAAADKAAADKTAADTAAANTTAADKAAADKAAADKAAADKAAADKAAADKAAADKAAADKAAADKAAADKAAADKAAADKAAAEGAASSNPSEAAAVDAVAADHAVATDSVPAEQPLAAAAAAADTPAAGGRRLAAAAAAAAPAVASTVRAISADPVKLSTGPLEATATRAARGLASVSVGGQRRAVSARLLRYVNQGFNGAGAYTFKADGDPQLPEPTLLYVAEGPVVSEVRATYENVGTLTARLWAGAEHVEVEWAAGKLHQGENIEVFVRYDTDAKTEGLWHTDANGREFQQRKRDFRPSFTLSQDSMALPGNIYPITTGVYLRDGGGVVALAVDRAQGAASMADGQLDVNVHRVSAGDDGKGMREPLVDPGVAVGTHVLSFHAAGSGDGGGRAQRSTPRHHQQALNDPLQLAFSEVPAATSYAATSTGLADGAALPPGVHLLTLKWLSCDTVLLRLSHMFQAGELVAPGGVDREARVVDLRKLLKLSVTGVTEATLYGERALQDSDARPPPQRFQRGANLTRWSPPLALPAGGPLSFTANRVVGPVPAGAEVTLQPMQIRSFYVKVKRERGACEDPPEPPRPAPSPTTGGWLHAVAGGGAARAEMAAALQAGGAPPPQQQHHGEGPALLSTGAAGWLQGAAAEAVEQAERAVEAGVSKASAWEAAAVDRLKHSSAALMQRASSGELVARVPLSREALLVMLFVPLGVAIGIAFMLLNHHKLSRHSGYHKPSESKV